jgi:periplasmic protein TonB
MPVARGSRRISTIVSILIHVAIVLLLVTDFASHEGFVLEKPQGAGGEGPAGGGGGGHRGTGGSEEHVRYVQVTPPPAPVAAVIPPVIPQPQIIPPLVPPPVQVKAEPTPELKPEVKVDAKASDLTAPTPGKGGGTGNDGTAGNGPGTGGGVGTGIGTGRGSGTGPGTGGGVQANYPPTPTEMFIPPLPMPDKVRGFHLVAEYDIDSTGKVVGFTFTPTRDGGYNKRLKEVLNSFKFRPGTTPAGNPIRMKAQIIYDF